MKNRNKLCNGISMKVFDANKLFVLLIYAEYVN